MAPPWRCKDCVKATNAVQRISGGPAGRGVLLLCALSTLDIGFGGPADDVLVDKKAELRLAYKDHALARTSQSSLYCAAAILDAAAQDQPFKDLGLLTKLIHPERTSF